MALGIPLRSDDILFAHCAQKELGLTQKALSPAAAWYFMFLYVLFSPCGVKKEHTKRKNPCDA
jgi:hypothetical protein